MRIYDIPMDTKQEKHGVLNVHLDRYQEIAS